MKTCENCEYYNENDSDETIFAKRVADGYCEMLECGTNAKEMPCKRFVEKECE